MEGMTAKSTGRLDGGGINGGGWCWILGWEKNLHISTLTILLRLR